MKCHFSVIHNPTCQPSLRNPPYNSLPSLTYHTDLSLNHRASWIQPSKNGSCYIFAETLMLELLPILHFLILSLQMYFQGHLWIYSLNPSKQGYNYDISMMLAQDPCMKGRKFGSYCWILLSTELLGRLERRSMSDVDVRGAELAEETYCDEIWRDLASTYYVAPRSNGLVVPDFGCRKQLSEAELEMRSEESSSQ